MTREEVIDKIVNEKEIIIAKSLWKQISYRSLLDEWYWVNEYGGVLHVEWENYGKHHKKGKLIYYYEQSSW